MPIPINVKSLAVHISNLALFAVHFIIWTCHKTKFMTTFWHICPCKSLGNSGTSFQNTPVAPWALTLQCRTTTCWESVVSHVSMALHMAQILSSGGAWRSGQPKSWTWSLKYRKRLCGLRRFKQWVWANFSTWRMTRGKNVYLWI